MVFTMCCLAAGRTRRLMNPLPATSARSSHSRSEEHTSELQSPDHLVCRLLLEKKKKKQCMSQQNFEARKWWSSHLCQRRHRGRYLTQAEPVAVCYFLTRAKPVPRFRK